MKEQTLIDMQRKSSSAMSRLDQLEQAMTALTGMIDKRMNEFIETHGQLTDALNAVIELVGPDAVQKVLSDKAYARLAEQEKQVNDALLAGNLVLGTNVKPNSIVMYEEKDAAGNVRPPGKFYRNMFSLNPDARNLLEGKAVGFESPIGAGGSMKLLGIFDVVNNPVSAPVAPVAAPEPVEAVAAVPPTPATAPTTADPVVPQAASVVSVDS